VKRKIGIGRKGQGIGTAEFPVAVVGASCHCSRVIGAKFRRREENLHSPGGGPLGKNLAEPAVRGYPSGDDDAFKLKPPCGPQGLLHQNLHHRLQKGSAKVRKWGSGMGPKPIDRRSFEAGKAHIEPGLEHGPRERNGIGIPFLREFIDFGAGRVRKAQKPAELVQGLASCVIPRSAQNLVLAPTRYPHKEGMPSGNDQAQKRRFYRRFHKSEGEKVGGQVVYAHKGHPKGEGHARGIGSPHKKGTDQPRAIRDPHKLHLFPANPRRFQSLLGQGRKLAEMIATCRLRHHSTIAGMEVRLGINEVREDLAAILKDRHRRLVAGSLDP
jgi:hypothetical protein